MGTVPSRKWVFCNHLLPVLRKRIQAHICTHKFYTAQTPESGVLQTAGQASVKRNGNCIGGGIKELVTNIVLFMLHGVKSVEKE